MVHILPIRVLIWADLLAVCALWVLTTYLTEVWGLSITHAAGILNIWGGIILILPLVLAYLKDACLGNFTVLALSSVAFTIQMIHLYVGEKESMQPDDLVEMEFPAIISYLNTHFAAVKVFNYDPTSAYLQGLGLLSMSTPPVFSCSKYKPECIGHIQKSLFYTALALIAIGMSGHIVSLEQFILEQQPGKKTDDKKNTTKVFRRPRIREIILALFVVVGGIALPYIKPWSIRFGILAICTLVATIVFLSVSCSYRKEEPQGLPDTDEPQRLPHTNGLRCLDKAALKLPNQERKKWLLCTVTQTKIAIRMVPVWVTFIICGLVSSAGSTYFQEQANSLSREVGKLKVPLTILLVLQESAKKIFSWIYQALFKGHEKYAPPIGIAGAMIFAVLSCITAAKVEARRLDVIRSHDLIEKPEDTIPMNFFWMLPQFLLLAGLDSFFLKSVSDFFRQQSPTSMEKYHDYFARGVFGLGYMASVLTAFVVGKISEREGKPNWFQYTLNKSRLDRYFWTLSGMCAVNFIVYILVVSFYLCRQPPASDGEDQPDEEQPQNEELG